MLLQGDSPNKGYSTIAGQAIGKGSQSVRRKRAWCNRMDNSPKWSKSKLIKGKSQVENAHEKLVQSVRLDERLQIRRYFLRVHVRTIWTQIPWLSDLICRFVPPFSKAELLSLDITPGNRLLSEIYRHPRAISVAFRCALIVFFQTMFPCSLCRLCVISLPLPCFLLQ